MGGASQYKSIICLDFHVIRKKWGSSHHRSGDLQSHCACRFESRITFLFLPSQQSTNVVKSRSTYIGVCTKFQTTPPSNRLHSTPQIPPYPILFVQAQRHMWSPHTLCLFPNMYVSRSSARDAKTQSIFWPKIKMYVCM